MAGFDDDFYDVTELLFDGVQEVVEGRECQGIAGLRSREFSRFAAFAVEEDEFHYAAEVDVGQGGVGAQFAGQVGLDAAAGVPVERFAQGDAFVHEHTDADFVVVEGGESGAHRHQFNDFAQEGVGVFRHVVAHGERGLVEFRVHGGLDYHVGEVVYGVAPRFVDAAGAEVLEHGIA